MADEPYTKPRDYRQYDQVWRRVNPRENPYPEVRRETESASVPEASPEAVNAILREELRHARELLKILENSLA